jgi:hypothetical protein
MGYDPSKLLEQVGNDAYKLSLPPYMCIYSMVNEKKLKLCEPYMLDEENEGKVLLFIQDLTFDAHEELA